MSHRETIDASKIQPAKRKSSTPPTALRAQAYAAMMVELKAHIRTAQTRAALAVNRELICLYWQIGKLIVERQASLGWGKSIVEKIARDLHSEFPGNTGFSAQNLWKMRAFYAAWNTESTILSQPVTELPGVKFLPPGRSFKNSKHQRAAELDELAKLLQPVTQLSDSICPRAIADIPWGHNIALIYKLKRPNERLWYAQQTTLHGWSRAVLIHQIDTRLYHRQGAALTNFHRTLPAGQSALAHQALKDPYNLSFLNLPPEAVERDLQRALLAKIRDFLMELGAGFALVGQERHIKVGDKDFYLDLLFYHIPLRRYLVIDLKMREFEPEFSGKMGFYLSVVDDLFRQKSDRPTLGLILCKSRNKLIAEYTLRQSPKPIGIATYTTHKLPKDLQRALPSVRKIESELQSITDHSTADRR